MQFNEHPEPARKYLRLPYDSRIRHSSKPESSTPAPETKALQVSDHHGIVIHRPGMLISIRDDVVDVHGGVSRSNSGYKRQ